MHSSSKALVAEKFRLPQHRYGIQKLAVLPQPASITRIRCKLANVPITSTNHISIKQLVSADGSIQAELRFCFDCLFTTAVRSQWHECLTCAIFHYFFVRLFACTIENVTSIPKYAETIQAKIQLFEAYLGLLFHSNVKTIATDCRKNVLGDTKQ